MTKDAGEQLETAVASGQGGLVVDEPDLRTLLEQLSKWTAECVAVTT